MNQPVRLTLPPFAQLLGLAVALSTPLALSAQSADTPPAKNDAAAEDPVKLDQFVITAVARPDKSQLQSSVSVSSLSIEKLELFTPRNTAELFRSLPGIRVESTSGEGNANLTIRGIPLSDGGSRYVQFQEDGLPIVEFGDIAFGNADVLFRSDATIGNVEAVRGGSAAIFASNSPGGAINMISKNGTNPGGTLALIYGLDFDTTRAEFNYGGPINPDTRFNVGGFYRRGEGPRTTGTTGGGGQVKLNVTRDLPNGGYLRLHLKAIDDTAPTYLPAPAKVNSVSSFGNLPGYNVLTGSLYTPNLTTDNGVDTHGQRVTRHFDGIRSKVASIGAEVMVSPADDLTITDRVRVASQSAQWGAPFPASIRTASDALKTYAPTFTGATKLVYASGDAKGQTVASDALVTTVHAFDTNARDLGWMGNDLKINKFIKLGDGAKLDFTAGYYSSQQKIVQDWAWASYLLETKGKNAGTINLANTAGTALTSNGQLSYGPIDWGNFSRGYDLTYTVDAPVASVTYQNGPLSLDAGVRHDNVKARGSVIDGTARSYDLNGDGAISGAELGGVPTFDWSKATNVNYSLGYTSYSAGANYGATKDLAFFGRFSFGGRAGADRLALNAGSSGPGFQAKSFYYDVRQAEVGVKYRTAKLLPGRLVFNATLFNAKTREPSGAELNKVNPPIDYTSTGLELEGSYRLEGFELRANATYTHARGSVASGTGRLSFDPRRQADFIYTIAPSYTFGAFSLGGSAIGTTESYFQDPAHGTTQNATAIKLPAYVTINGFAAYTIAKNVTLTVSVNNLFNATGWTEGEDGSLPAANALPITRARTIPGRTTSLTLRYAF
ncbi:MAG: TonB-dependent receptor [Verrucomicrobia bacterium]|nr:TonB-dependent receptor [Verrucomicrobiota bacterium]